MVNEYTTHETSRSRQQAKFAWLTLSTLMMEATCSSETLGSLSDLHMVITQKTVLITVTTLRTSNPTEN
jgi:hypothetical protein